MPPRRIPGLAAAVLSLLASAAHAGAQAAAPRPGAGAAAGPPAGRRVSVGLSGGPLVGTGLGIGLGGHLAASAVVARRPGGTAALRADGTFGLTDNVGGRRRLGALTLAAVVPVRAGRAFVPYALAGAGAYAVPGGGGLQAGVNAGVGVEGAAARVRPFAELRVHRLLARQPGGVVHLTPLALGARF